LASKAAVAADAVASEADPFSIIPDPLAEATAEAASRGAEGSGNAAWTTGGRCQYSKSMFA
jgi:hypothetical protein